MSLLMRASCVHMLTAARVCRLTRTARRVRPSIDPAMPRQRLTTPSRLDLSLVGCSSIGAGKKQLPPSVPRPLAELQPLVLAPLVRPGQSAKGVALQKLPSLETIEMGRSNDIRA